MSRRAKRRRCPDFGSATLEIVVLFPAVLLATFGLVQGALYYHARNVALAAATDGLTAARSRGGSAEQGREAALAFLGKAGGETVLPASSVRSVRSPTTATVTVTWHAVSLVPGLPGWAVVQTASGPVERFTSVGQP